MKKERSRLGWMAFAVLPAAGFGIYALAPGLVTAVLPYALLAACPVSMLLMMKLMHGDQGTPHEYELDLAAEQRLARLKAQQAALDEKIGALERKGSRPSAEKYGNPTDEGARTS